MERIDYLLRHGKLQHLRQRFRIIIQLHLISFRKLLCIFYVIRLVIHNNHMAICALAFNQKGIDNTLNQNGLFCRKLRIQTVRRNSQNKGLLP